MTELVARVPEVLSTPAVWVIAWPDVSVTLPALPFTLPAIEGTQQWQRVFDTFDPHGVDRMYRAGARYALQGRSVAVFKFLSPLRQRRRMSDLERAVEAFSVEN